MKIKNKAVFKGICAVLFAACMLTGCGNSASDTNSEIVSDDTESTEEVTEELTYQDILDKAVDYFGKYVSLEKYDIDKTSYGDQQIYITNYDMDEANLSFTVTIGEDVPLTVRSTKTSELLDYGCMKGNQEKAYPDGDDVTEDVYMLYNEKYFHIGEDRPSDQKYFSEMIRYVDFQTDEKAVEFEYCGLTANSSLEEVVDRLGSPNNTNVIIYNEESDKYAISLCYSGQYHTDEDKSIFANFTFEYDYKTDTAKLVDLFLNT